MSYRSRMAIVADLIAEFDYRLLIEPPAITRAVGDFSKPDAYEDFRLNVERNAARLKQTLSVREEAREIVWRGLDQELGPNVLSDLDEWIEKLDVGIDRNTKSFIDTAQFLKRELKFMRGKIDKKKMAEYDRVFSRGQEIWAQEIAETIDFATFLRAVRASKFKSLEPVATFDNPVDLTRYLENAIGDAG